MTRKLKVGRKMSKQLLVMTVAVFSIYAQAGAGKTPVFSQGDRVYVCNTASDFTNLREGPTAQGSAIVGQLPNSLEVEITIRRVNAAGFTYYLVYTLDPDGAWMGVRGGYLHEDTLQRICDIPSVLTPQSVAMPARLGPRPRLVMIWRTRSTLCRG